MIHLIQATTPDNKCLYAFYDCASNKQTCWENIPSTIFHTTDFKSIDNFYGHIRHAHPSISFTTITSASTLPSIINSYPELFL